MSLDHSCLSYKDAFNRICRYWLPKNRVCSPKCSPVKVFLPSFCEWPYRKWTTYQTKDCFSNNCKIFKRSFPQHHVCMHAHRKFWTNSNYNSHFWGLWQHSELLQRSFTQIPTIIPTSTSTTKCFCDPTSTTLNSLSCILTLTCVYTRSFTQILHKSPL